MSGPCSLPNGNRDEWNRHNEIVCDIHLTDGKGSTCTPATPKMGGKGEEIAHVFVTYRVWLLKRNRLRTGKTR